MVYSVSLTAISAASRAAFAADKTLFVAKNILETRNVAPEWRRSGSWTSGQDDTESGAPATRAAENYIDNPTRPEIPGGGAVSEYYLIFDLVEAPTGTQNALDAIALIGHNFHDLPGTITVEVQLANSSDFSSPFTIASWANAGADRIRLVDLNLSSNFVRYSNIRYLRIRIATTATFTTAPELGEVVAGARLQMGFKPNQPWNPKRIVGDVPKARTRGGGSTYYERNVNGVVLTPSWSPTLGVDQFSGLDDEATLWSLFRQSGSGTKNFLFVDAPSSAPRVAHWVGWDDPNFEIAVPAGMVDQGEFNGSFTEQSPFYWNEAT